MRPNNIPWILIGATVTVAALFFYFAKDFSTYVAPKVHRVREEDSQSWAQPLYEVIDGTEIVWQKPSQPRAVIFLAHGCSHGAIDFWPNHERCSQCIGLPEEAAVTRTCLSRGYAVVAVSSQARTSHRCWRLGAPGLQGGGQLDGDLAKVKSVLAALLSREGLAGLPLFAMGASSGGAFVLAFAMVHPVKALCAQIMALPAELMEQHFEQHSTAGGAQSGAGPYPPTMYVHMPRDGQTALMVYDSIQALKAHNVATKEIQVQPAPLTETYLYDTCKPEITEEQSLAIYQAFRSGGVINDQGFLTEDPRRGLWRKVLKQAQVPGYEAMRLKADESPISEELNRLYAMHELVASTTSDMLTWFQSHLLR